MPDGKIPQRMTQSACDGVCSVCRRRRSCESLTNDRNKYNGTVHFSTNASTSHHTHTHTSLVSIWVQIRNKWKPNNKLSCLLSTTEKTDNVGMQLHATFHDWCLAAWPIHAIKFRTNLVSSRTHCFVCSCFVACEMPSFCHLNITSIGCVCVCVCLWRSRLSPLRFYLRPIFFSSTKNRKLL